MQLAALRAELVNVLHLAHRIAQIFRNVELCELILAEIGQLFAEVAQFVHLLFDLGFAGRQLFLTFGRNRLVAQPAPRWGSVVARLGQDDFHLAIFMLVFVIFQMNM